MNTFRLSTFVLGLVLVGGFGSAMAEVGAISLVPKSGQARAEYIKQVHAEQKASIANFKIQKETARAKKIETIKTKKQAIKVSTERKKTEEKFYSPNLRVTNTGSMKGNVKSVSPLKRGYFPYKAKQDVKSSYKTPISNPALKVKTYSPKNVTQKSS